MRGPGLLLQRLGRGRRVLGQEGDAGGVAALAGQTEVDHGPEELVGDLDQEAGAVTGELGARVLEPLLPVGDARLDQQVTGTDQRIIIVCNEGYSSSLAAATLRRASRRVASSIRAAVLRFLSRRV